MLTTRTQVVAWIIVVVIAMIAWTIVTLGFRAILVDPACGGVACDRIREESANLRAMLLAAWIAGELVGAAILAWLTVRLRRIGRGAGRTGD